MEHDDLVLKKNREKNCLKKRKSERSKEDPEYFVNTYGIDHLKLVKLNIIQVTPCTAQDRLDGKKKLNDKILTHKCNVQSTLLNIIKGAK